MSSQNSINISLLLLVHNIPGCHNRCCLWFCCVDKDSSVLGKFSLWDLLQCVSYCDISFCHIMPFKVKIWVLTVLKMSAVVFWVVMPCSQSCMLLPSFGGTYCLCIQNPWFSCYCYCILAYYHGWLRMNFIVMSHMFFKHKLGAGKIATDANMPLTQETNKQTCT
jgi:hypothetical protein